jgi:lysocardiolipin and lysophospholipid acyltransferase
MLGRAVMPLMIVSAIWGTVHFILLAAIVFLPFSRAAYRMVVDAVEWCWLTNAAAMIELLAGVRIVATGESLRSTDKRVLIICNHNCRLDWMFLWCLAARVGCCSTLKIALKDNLRKAPYFGWACQAFLFIFFSRKNREGDLDRLRHTLGHCFGHGDDVALLIFPEGTDISPANQQKDAEFAKAKGLEQHKHTLHPRTAGFVEAVKAFGDARLDAVYNVTVRYDNHPTVLGSADPRPNEKSALFGGRWPSAAHLHCERLGGDALRGTVLGAGSDAAGWLEATWRDKERRLTSAAGTADGALASGTAAQPPAWAARPTAKYLLVMIGLALLTATLGSALCAHGGWMLRTYTLAGSFVLAALTKWGGLDALEYARHPIRGR